MAAIIPSPTVLAGLALATAALSLIRQKPQTVPVETDLEKADRALVRDFETRYGDGADYLLATAM